MPGFIEIHVRPDVIRETAAGKRDREDLIHVEELRSERFPKENPVPGRGIEPIPIGVRGGGDFAGQSRVVLGPELDVRRIAACRENHGFRVNEEFLLEPGA